jgi:hypothetical protein
MDNRRHILAAAVASALMLSGLCPSSAASETPIYDFKGKTDGSAPQWPLLVMPDSISYGSTPNGGQYQMGQVFKMDPPSATDSSWRKEMVYDFANPETVGWTDGYTPAGNLVPGPEGSGSFYGTTLYGGQSTDTACNAVEDATKGCGTVFQLWPPAAPGDTWRKDILYSFNNSGDGTGPNSLIEDSDGNLYGTTKTTAFELSPSIVDGETVWTLKVLHAFNGTTDGTGPNPGLLMDSAGVIYGTTPNGAITYPNLNNGTVFTLTPPSSPGGPWTYAQVYDFQGGTTDGAVPNGGLLGGPGTGSSPGVYLWGTTQAGGANGLGTLFQLEQTYADEPYGDSLQHSFSGGSDGGVPMAGLFESDDGSYWGTASQGGLVEAAYACGSGCGVVFEYQRKFDFNRTVYTFSTIAEFAGYGYGDGSDPNTALGVDSNGSLYGMTNSGGTTGEGTIFMLADAAPVYTVATPSMSPPAGGYTTPQTVTITDSTGGATIYYTTDGTKPTSSSAEFLAPITVSSNETIKAIAMLNGWLPSAVVHAAYTIEPRVAKPTFSLKAGTYSTPQPLSMTDATVGAKIYYTTDGTKPTTSSTLYTAAITVSTTETIEAVAVLNGYLNSGIQNKTYTITGD